MNTEINFISVKDRRYETVGDYFHKNGNLVVSVCDTGNDDYNFLIAMHELIEEYLTRKRGISELSILEFDRQYEDNRVIGDDSEPGDSKDAPYQREHRFAENIERVICHEIGINWFDYNNFLIKFAENHSGMFKR